MLAATECDLLPDLQSHTQEEVCQWDTWRSLPDVEDILLSSEIRATDWGNTAGRVT